MQKHTCAFLLFMLATAWWLNDRITVCFNPLTGSVCRLRAFSEWHFGGFSHSEISHWDIATYTPIIPIITIHIADSLCCAAQVDSLLYAAEKCHAALHEICKSFTQVNPFHLKVGRRKLNQKLAKGTKTKGFPCFDKKTIAFAKIAASWIFSCSADHLLVGLPCTAHPCNLSCLNHFLYLGFGVKHDSPSVCLSATSAQFSSSQAGLWEALLELLNWDHCGTP